MGFHVTKGRPVVTLTLVGLNVAVFLLGPVIWGEDWSVRLGLSPDYWQEEPWRIVTSGFAHFGVVHLLFNMVALYQFGMVVETLLGWWRYLTVYGLSLLGGGAVIIALGDPRTVHAGASGAIFGILAAFIVLSMALKRPAYDLMVLAGLWIAFGFFVEWLSWEGHLGGAVAGSLTTLLFVHLQGRRRPSRVVR